MGGVFFHDFYLFIFMKLNYKDKQCLRHSSEFLMSSPPLSITQQLQSSVSMVVSNNKNHHVMSTSYQDLSGQEIYNKMQ